MRLYLTVFEGDNAIASTLFPQLQLTAHQIFLR